MPVSIFYNKHAFMPVEKGVIYRYLLYMIIKFSRYLAIFFFKSFISQMKNSTISVFFFYRYYCFHIIITWMLNIFYNDSNQVPVCNRKDRLSSLQSVSLFIMCGLHVIHVLTGNVVFICVLISVV